MFKGKNGLWSLLLAVPLFAFTLHYYFAHEPGIVATGFSQADNIVYVSNARQHAENGGLLYANPFALPGSPAIYSQAYNFILLLLLQTGLDPGLSLTIFGLLSALACIYVALQLVDHLYPKLPHRRTIHTLLVWGGGLTAIGGMILALTLFRDTHQVFPGGIYLIDPGNGWWGLNFGRTLMIPVEAFYHLLFLLGILFSVQGRWVAAFLAAFILSWSHPFTGIEYLSIAAAWLFLEKAWAGNKSIPWTFVLAMGALLLLHLLYYLVYLNSFPEHRKLFEVFSVDWGYSWRVYVPAYAIVGWLALQTIRQAGWKRAFAAPHQRLFMCWAIIAFLLSNHEWFMKPIQPIHFTRGYIWMGLFLFSIPALQQLLQRIGKKFIAGLLILLLLSDNLLWYAAHLGGRASGESETHITHDTKAVLDWLHDHAGGDHLLVSNEYLVGYMANAYGASYSWTGHRYNTPGYDEKRAAADSFFKTGMPLPEWSGRKLLVLVNRKNGLQPHPSITRRPLFQNAQYAVYAF